jgi:hypothetical protein
MSILIIVFQKLFYIIVLFMLFKIVIFVSYDFYYFSILLIIFQI